MFDLQLIHIRRSLDFLFRVNSTAIIIYGATQSVRFQPISLIEAAQWKIGGTQ